MSGESVERRARGAAWGETWKAAVLFVALTLVLAYPLSTDPARRMLPLGPDGDLFLWTIGWDVHALTHQPLSIFDANIYYPEPNTLAYSENLIGEALLAAPVLWLTGNHVLALNVVVLLATVLCGLGTYLLARRLGIGPAGAVVSGLVFAFSPPRFFRLGQLHLGSVQWVPFALLFFHGYLQNGRRRDLWLAAAFFSLQALSSGHGAVFLALAMLLLVAWRTVLGEPLKPVRRLRDLGVPGVLTLLPAILVFVPYRSVQSEMGLRRTLENWAIDPVSFVASPTHVHAHLLSALPFPQVLDQAQAYLFPGLVPILLASVSLWPRRLRGAGEERPWRERLGKVAALTLDLLGAAAWAVALVVAVGGPIRLAAGDIVWLSARTPWRACALGAVAFGLRVLLGRRVPFRVPMPVRARMADWRARTVASRQDVTVFYGALTGLALWLSIGPPIGLWPLVYWLPGMNFIRVPSRFTILAVLGLAVLAGAGLERVAGSLSSRGRRLAGAVAGLLLAAEFAAIPLVVVPYSLRIPAADRWLATRPGPFAVVDLPLPDPTNAGAFERRQTAFMLGSMAHWQRTVNGYSGIRPPFHAELYERLRAFPDEASIESLQRIGVHYVVVHTDLYDGDEWPEVRRRLKRFEHSVKLEHVAGAGRVYSLNTDTNSP